MAKRSKITKRYRKENPDEHAKSDFTPRHLRGMGDGSRDLRWFRALVGADSDGRSSSVHPRVWGIMERLRMHQRIRRQMYLYQSCLYDDLDAGSLGSLSMDSVTYDPATLSMNVIKPIVDTFVSRIAKSAVVPSPLTSGGNWSQQRRAKELKKYFAGRFESVGVPKMSPIVARDAGLWGTGFTHNYRVGKRIKHERFFPWELLVDPREAQYGTPRNVIRMRHVDRLELIERFPEFEEEIESARSRDDDDFGITMMTNDMVLVLEAWHLPSGDLNDDGELVMSERPNDGRHAICISNATLLFEEYKRSYFPFGRYVMQEPLMGWFGSGFGKQLSGLQYTINESAMVVAERHHLSGAYVFVDDASQISVDHLDNDPGVKVIRSSGGRTPQFVTPQPVHPQSWQFVLDLLPLTNKLSRVSEMAMHGDKPAGIQSGKALQELTDNQDAGWSIASTNYDQYHMDLAWQFFDLEEEIAEEYGDQSVVSKGSSYGAHTADKIQWSKVRLDRESFVLDVFPTSALPRTPAARIDYVQSLANAGWLSPDEAKMLLDFPDLERVNNLGQAAYNLVGKLIDRFLSAPDPEAEDVYVYPEPEFNLDLCVVMTQQAYLNAKVDGADEKNLALLLQFIADARAEAKKAKDGDAPPPPAPGAMDGVPAPDLPPPPGGPPGPPGGQPMAAAPIQGTPPPPTLAGAVAPAPPIAA